MFPPDESNNILQMKTTFKKISPRNKPTVSKHSCNGYKSTNHNYNITRNLSILEKTIRFPLHLREDKYYLLHFGGGDINHLTVKIEGKVIFVII